MTSVSLAPPTQYFGRVIAIDGVVVAGKPLSGMLLRDSYALSGTDVPHGTTTDISYGTNTDTL